MNEHGQSYDPLTPRDREQLEMKMATTKKPDLLELAELVKQLDEALHRSMPVGGNANHERAQAMCNEVRRKIEELRT